MFSVYEEEVVTKFHIYNSLFLNLPFPNITHTGTLLQLLLQECNSGFERNVSAIEIIDSFFNDYIPSAKPKEKFDILFKFIQYVERQVALFDSIEDSVFDKTNNLKGKGTVSALLMRADVANKTEALKAKLNEFSLRLVLTAHPTQFYPGHVLGILTDLEESIRNSDFHRINLLLSQLGKSPFINKEKPSPFDEAVSLCWFLENVFYKAIPQVVSSLATGLDIGLNEWTNNRLIVIGFWPGGDRDGNPFVTHDITLRVAARLKESILKCYHRDLRNLRRRLTFKGIYKIIEDTERKVYSLLYGDKPNYSPEELIIELQKGREVLIHDHDGLFVELIDLFILKVKFFGFHFASLDIRQESGVHGKVWNSIFSTLYSDGSSVSGEQYNTYSESKKIEYLLSLKVRLDDYSFSNNLVDEALKTIQTISQIQRENGVMGCHRYVISNTKSALHLMEVFVLSRLLIGNEDNLELDFVPLFESINDLANASAVMERLYSIPSYRSHLEKRKNHQSIMLGFSDGTKDGGYLRSNWSIFRAKEDLTLLSRKYGIVVLFFDGRGGPPGRGGGNTHDFYASLGETIEHQEVQVTIQGQTINSNFGRPASCIYNIEQLVSAGVEGKVFMNTDYQLTLEDKALLDKLAEEGYQSYKSLKDNPKFVPYLENVTPLFAFGDSNIGSRPMRRNGEEMKFEDLRAIPFVGSWAMMKQNIPGFYGVGSALSTVSKNGKQQDLIDLYKNSLFFRTLLGNSMMSLTKSSFKPTAYLGDDFEFGGIWNLMHDEYVKSNEMLLKISGLSQLMENNPMILKSVGLREQIVLPLVAIQQYALMNLRYNNDENHINIPVYKKLIVRCMFGIINASRNSA